MAARWGLHNLSRRVIPLLSSSSRPALRNPVLAHPRNNSSNVTGCPPRLIPSSNHFSRFVSSVIEGENQDTGTRNECIDGDEVAAATSNAKQEYTNEEKEAEAALIGYKVLGPLQPSDRVFKPYKPVFAIVQIGSHQFKVSNNDCIFTERLKFCDVNDKIVLNKVLLLGSEVQTIVGRPTIPHAVVHAVVEEHALDAKVIIFKKKRRKNYRRTNGHRQELTQLRITDIKGISSPKTTTRTKSKLKAPTEEEKIPIAT